MNRAGRWLWMGGIVLLGWLLYLLQPILAPFLLGMLFAYMGNPLVDRLERHQLSRTMAVVVVFVLFTLILSVLLLVLLPLLGRQLVRLYQALPEMLDWFQVSVTPGLQAYFGVDESFWQLDHLKEMLAGNLGKTSNVLKLVLAQATSSGLALLAWVGNLLLVPVVSFYLMRDWHVLLTRVRNLLPRRQEEIIVRLTGECHEVLGAFLRGQLLVMLALGIVYAVGLMSLGLELGLLIGLFAGLASIVPYMGFIVGISAAVAAALFQFGIDPYPLLGILAVFGVGQMLEGMLLTPMLVGDRIGLHPVAVIFAILAGGQLFGFTGVLLALPVAAVIMVLLRHGHELYKLSSLYGAGDAGTQSPPGSS